MKLWEAVLLKKPVNDVELDLMYTYRHFMRKYSLTPAEVDAMDCRLINGIMELDIADNKALELVRNG